MSCALERGENKFDSYSYFILCFKSTGDRLKIVNPTNAVLKRVTSVVSFQIWVNWSCVLIFVFPKVRKHFVILKTDWAQHSTVTFKLQKNKTPGGRHAFIMLTADVLLALFLAGWEPMTPINLGSGSYSWTFSLPLKDKNVISLQVKRMRPAVNS